MLNAIFVISIKKELLLFDLYNIQIYKVICDDNKFSLYQYLEKFSIEGHSFDCIKPMVKFLILRYWSHREQC